MNVRNLSVIGLLLILILSACVATDKDLENAMNKQATQVAEQIQGAVDGISEPEPIDYNKIAEEVLAAMPAPTTQPAPTPEPTPDPVLSALDAIVDKLDQLGSDGAQSGNLPDYSSSSVNIAGGDLEKEHWNRLVTLDSVFRSSGLETWLTVAGYSWSYLSGDARQVEEETRSDGKIFASGIQVQVEDLMVAWPNCMTTDEQVTPGSDSRYYQPDPNNPSVLWTDVPSFSGQATLYVDCQNWGELYP